MSPADRILAAAAALSWVTEDTGNNDGEMVEWILGGPRERGLPWCAAFVLAAYWLAGVPIARREERDWYTLRNVSALQSHATQRGWFLGPNIRPQPGDVVLYARRGASDTGRGRHCGIVTDVGDEIVRTVEGNLGNAVRASEVQLGSPRISGWIRLPQVTPVRPSD